MKYSICLFLFVLIFLQACKKDEVQIPTCENCNFNCLDMNENDVITNNCFDNWECSFNIFSQSKVDIDEVEGHTAGDKNIFQLTYSTQGDDGIADDEVYYTLVMELDALQNSFSAEGKELEDMNTHFRKACFCADVRYKTVTSGCIQGEKQSDGTWFIQGNLEMLESSEPIDVKFDAQFVN